MIKTWEEPFIWRYLRSKEEKEKEKSEESKEDKEKKRKKDTKIGIVELVLVEKRLHSYFNFVYRRVARNSMSFPEVQPTIFHYHSPAPDLRSYLGLHNRFATSLLSFPFLLYPS
jgi:hypothetical protein